MHELSIAQNIIDIVEENTKSIRDQKVKFIHLKRGEMSNVLIDSLNFSFESLIQGTRLEGAKLLIEEIPVRLFCKNCHRQTEVKEHVFKCAYCDSNEVEMISGNELTINELEVE